jgi:GTPase SAR1 family protein
MSQSQQLKKRLRSLEKHLSQENPILLQTVSSFRKLDRVCYRLGLLEPEESLATRISWWPMISVLGTYSSGKSTFINHYVGQDLQLTGNQAVDDRFTVICYTHGDDARVLPGLALDADPRFPFYRLSRSIEELGTGEGRRIDAYLQLKTSARAKVRGKIIIDSPGFDADDQRTSILRITDHIIDLSDLVLVFFDARHPEAGTMRDTLDHLVAQTIARPDSSKFLYVLNQIDTTAREDNPEDVIASWQRALAQKGLTAGRFYRIYNPTAAVAIEDDTLRQRFEAKRDVDMKEIHDRMEQVGIDRAYRVVGALEQTARDIQDLFVPRLEALLAEWRQRVLRLDAVVFGLLAAAVGGWTLWTGEWDGLSFSHPTWAGLSDLDPLWQLVLLAVVLMAGGYLHARLRARAARAVLARLAKRPPDEHDTRFADSLPRAFRNNAGGWRSIFWSRPAGWEGRSRRRVADVLLEANGYVQLLNDRYTDPSGTGGGAAG